MKAVAQGCAATYVSQSLFTSRVAELQIELAY